MRRVWFGDILHDFVLLGLIMDFGEFSDVSLDTNDSSNFKSCDDSLSEAEDGSTWSNGLPSLTYCDKSLVRDVSTNYECS